MKLAKVSTSHIQAVTGTTFVSTLNGLMYGGFANRQAHSNAV